MTNTTDEVLVRVQATPNPGAWKYIINKPVLNEGKASFATKEEAFGNRLAEDLLNIEGVKHIHFFGNVITVTFHFDMEPEELHPSVISVIQTRMPVHDANFGIKESKQALRKELPQELQEIESILDRTIRPGLQGDGGDIEVLKYEDNKLYVAYQGACGTCPSSTSGTLMAIEGILKDEFNPLIEVIPM